MNNELQDHFALGQTSWDVVEALPGVPMIGDAVAGPGKKLVEDNDVSTSIIPTPSKNLTHRFFSIASN